MGILRAMGIGCAVLVASVWGGSCRAASWFPLGPYGGDARSLAADPADPKHLFLGTETGWIYDSHDGGRTWTRIAQVGNRDDLAIDHIVVDRTNPKRLIVGAFIVDHPADGGLFISEDYGKNWYSQAEMRGQSVRALTRSESNPKELVAGTLKGVFRSVDNGTHWQQISPEGSEEIHEVQSIAIDPADPNVIYAGTWHLPWKTTDGGTTWHNIKEGIIDDSDVFSIIVDPKDPKVVYASACSGIYKSSVAGETFHKVQGIPSAARRTRTLEQDPENLNVVFAGTTEGLYRTLDAGTQWERLTPADVIVNDVYVDPTNSNHVLLATDRGGVYRSEDGGGTFETSNAGFSTRQITAFAEDAQHPGSLFVGVVNGKTTGGVFESTDGAVHWQQTSEGLGGRDIFSLLSLEDGTLLAGTEHGIFRYTEGTWKDSSLMEGAAPAEKVAAAPKPVAHLAIAPAQVKVISGKRALSSRPVRSAAARKAVAQKRRLPGSRLPGARLPATTGSHAPHLVRVRGRVVPTSTGANIAGSAKAGQHTHSHPESHAPEPPARVRTLRAGKVDAEVYSLVRVKDMLFAASGAGLVRSGDGGQHWAAVPSLTLPDLRFLAVQPELAGEPSSGTAHADAATTPADAAAPAVTEGAAPPAGGAGSGVQAAVGSNSPGSGTMLAAGLSLVMISHDGGSTWTPLPLPKELTQVGAISIDGGGNLWVGGREGVWYSANIGADWKTLRNLFLTEVDNIFYDVAGQRVLVTGASSAVAFSVQLPAEKVTYFDTGWKLRFVRPVNGHLVGATLFDGMVVQPEMVDSPLAPVSAPAGR